MRMRTYMHDLPPAVRRYLWASYVACLALVSGQLVPFVAAGALWDHPVVPLQYVAVFLVLAYAGERIQLVVNGSLVMSLTTPVHIAVILLFPPPYPLLITLVAVLISQTSYALHTHRPLYKRGLCLLLPAPGRSEESVQRPQLYLWLRGLCEIGGSASGSDPDSFEGPRR